MSVDHGLVRHLVNSGLTYQEVGDRLGVTRERIRQIAKRVGVESHRSYRNGGLRKAARLKAIADERNARRAHIESLVARVRAGESAAGVAQDGGIDPATLRSYCQESGVTLRRGGRPGSDLPRLNIDVSEIARMARDGMNSTQIAKVLGLRSRASFFAWLRYRGLRFRALGEQAAALQKENAGANGSVQAKQERNTP